MKHEIGRNQTSTDFDSSSSNCENIEEIEIQNEQNIQDIKKRIGFTEREICYFLGLHKFFTNRCSDSDRLDVCGIITRANKEISLRMLDWIVSKDSIRRPFAEATSSSSIPYVFDIKSSYNAHLGSMSKAFFDPFRRGDKKFMYTFSFRDGTKKKFETTLGQLNFFKWVVDYKILNYAYSHKVEISKEMSAKNKNRKSKTRKTNFLDHQITNSSIADFIPRDFTLRFGN